jgi:hypothetical protein
MFRRQYENAECDGVIRWMTCDQRSQVSQTFASPHAALAITPIFELAHARLR